MCVVVVDLMRVGEWGNGRVGEVQERGERRGGGERDYMHMCKRGDFTTFFTSIRISTGERRG